jgi:hypothetical protein
MKIVRIFADLVTQLLIYESRHIPGTLKWPNMQAATKREKHYGRDTHSLIKRKSRRRERDWLN